MITYATFFFNSFYFWYFVASNMESYLPMCAIEQSHIIYNILRFL